MIKKCILFTFISMCILTACVSAAGIYKDPNVITLQHFDSQVSHQGWNQTSGYYPYKQITQTDVNYLANNISYDQTGLVWGSNTIQSTTGAAFGNYSMATGTMSADLIGQNEIGNTPYSSTPYNPSFDFGTTGSWNMQFRIKPSGTTAGNKTIIMWYGNSSTVAGGQPAGGVDGMIYNGSSIYIDATNFVCVLNPKLQGNNQVLRSAAALATGSYSLVSLDKNATTNNLDMYINGARTARLSSASTYNWSSGYTANAYQRIIGIQSATGFSVDEVYIANQSRIGGNFTSPTVNFVNLNNATQLQAYFMGANGGQKFPGTLTNPMPSDTYAYGDVLNYGLKVNNASLINSMILGLPGQSSQYLSTRLNNTAITAGFTMPTDPGSVLPTQPYSGFYENPQYVGRLLESTGSGVSPYASRSMAYIEAPTNTYNITTATPMLDFSVAAGTEFINDYPFTVNDPGGVQFVPSYSSLFEQWNGALNSPLIVNNLTTSPKVLNYQQLYYPGGINAGMFIDEPIPTTTFPLFTPFNITAHVWGMYLSNEVNIEIQYDRLNFTYVGYEKPGYEYWIDANTTISVINNAAAGTVTITGTPVNGTASTTLNWKDLITPSNDIPGVPQYTNMVSYNGVPVGTAYWWDMVRLKFVGTNTTGTGETYGTFTFNPSNCNVSYPSAYPNSFDSTYQQRSVSFGSLIYTFDDASGGETVTTSNPPIRTTLTTRNSNGGAIVNQLTHLSTTARNTTPVSPLDSETGVFTFLHTPGDFQITLTSAGYYAYTANVTYTTAGNHDLYLTPISGPQSNIWYTPHQVRFRTLDGSGTPVPNATILVYYDSTTLPNTSTSWLQTAYGISGTVVDQMINSGLAMEGRTDSAGWLTFTMHASLGYNLSITSPDLGVYNWFKEISPIESDYVLRIENPPLTDLYGPSTNTMVAMNGTQLWYGLANTSYARFGANVSDAAHKLVSVRLMVWDRGNNTVYNTQMLQVIGNTTATGYYDIKNIRGLRVGWNYTVVRN